MYIKEIRKTQKKKKKKKNLNNFFTEKYLFIFIKPKNKKSWTQPNFNFLNINNSLFIAR